MPDVRIIQRLPRTDTSVVEVIRTFRRLTGGRAVKDADRPTLLACSGGADSSALALILSLTKAPLVFAHVVHDLRPPEQALADRDRVRELAEVLSKPFVERSIAVRKAAGNAEGNARRARYRALAELARAYRCRFVATGHQADDQAETMLMRLLRGSGPRGLGAMAAVRSLGDGVELVRPMLGMARRECERLCGRAGWRWAEDQTNLDTGRLRAALRRDVMPVLRRLAPSFAERLGHSAGLLQDAAALVERRALELRSTGSADVGGGETFRRELLRRESGAVIGEILRSIVREQTGGRGADNLSLRTVTAAVRAVRDASTEPRTFRWCGALVTITAHEVRVATSPSQGPRATRE